MRKIYLATILCFALSATMAAQKIGKPTLTPTEATAAQKQLIQQGISLHDQKKYDEAIEKYAQVLKENPNNDLALYEMALSYYNKKDFTKTTETAYKLVQFKGGNGVLGYGLIANVLDDQGKPKEAVEIYRSAIKQLQGDAEFTSHLSSLYYNLGLTHTRQKQYKEAREALKKAVEYNFQYPSPNSLLAEIFYAAKYKIPALLAAGRMITLEINSPRSQRSAEILLQILKSSKKDGKGGATIFLNLDAPTDEGDFGAAELILGIGGVRTDEDKNKTDNEVFADSLGTLIAILGEDKKLASTFVGKTYIPFMKDLKNKGYHKHLAYLILQQGGNKEAEKWLIDQGQATIEFINWSRAYQLKK